jgi:UDP-GlcNAc:undecaprenyl-phosphate GlcNAc-1-phosphate transferase
VGLVIRPLQPHPLDPLVLLLAAFLITAALAFVLTPLARRLARRYGMVDRPNHRRVNVVPVPRAGGLAIAAAFLAVVVGFLAINDQQHLVRLPASIGQGELLALLVGGAAAALIGALDDYFQLRARWQLVGQAAVALLAVALGIEVGSLNSPFGGTISVGGLLAVILSVLWIIGMINSINFIDGLDGLSSGIGVIAAVTLGLISLMPDAGTDSQPFVAILCFGLAGALAGFLRWNFHPATIFTGTSGVMFLGYALAVLSILGAAKVAVALLVLGIPIIDTFWIIVRRLLSRRSPFTPDRGHIHHRLLDLGLPHTQAVLLIYAICVALGVLSFALSGTGQLYAFMGIVVIFGLILLVLTQRTVSEDLSAESYENDHAADTTGPASS